MIPARLAAREMVWRLVPSSSAIEVTVRPAAMSERSWSTSNAVGFTPIDGRS